VIVPDDPPAAGPDRALEPPPDPNPPAGLLLVAVLVAAGVAVAVAGVLLAAAVPDVLLQAATVAITPAAAAAAMTLPRLLCLLDLPCSLCSLCSLDLPRLPDLPCLLENMRLTPVVEILDLRYRRARRKCCAEKPEGGCKVVQHGLRAKATARVGKVTPRPPESRACGPRLTVAARLVRWRHGIPVMGVALTVRTRGW
jgi:hypothetical protein